MMTNYSVNVASKVNEFWIKCRIKILTISPYCPNINAIEKVILSIKLKTHSYLSEVKCFNKKNCKTQLIKLLFEIYLYLFWQVTNKLFKRWETFRRIFDWNFENKSW